MGSHNFGTRDDFQTKKAFKDAVAERGADKVIVYDTSMFDNRGTLPASELAPGDMVVGNPYTRRNWYANVKPGRDGVLKVV